ncbi:DUF3141 domain-containing protein [Azospirillum rugosum]|uniref:Poly(3-hydroxyalkanoate) synthetase n=1 Tax=Azospirillum rugosum TaxID=416170 RepID=A0ABS4STA8_9PROT|nr:DUF3141 domain-containing protein [Azospirillum rugosum]MBP2295806.1 hypothetical protein [Azospirillum rugosum]MDQ0529083.1 hypothetical protein [Azospirillum rugosum]
MPDWSEQPLMMQPFTTWLSAWSAVNPVAFAAARDDGPAAKGSGERTRSGTAGREGRQGTPVPALPNPVQDAIDYGVDAMQRWILFLDVMRRRGDQFLEHAQHGKPPVLTFPHEVVMDGRKLKRPCNYMLLHILPDPAVGTDPAKRPFIIVDPRAGHGPGIGGFKPDSQIGAALRAGHPCYFIGFTPDPVPGQTLSDVGAAEAAFIEHVGKQHARADGKPCVIGNCQAGWAVMALSAVHPELMGPLIIAGSPLSYWAGVKGKNPMRYLGGLYGGAWLAALAGDLGNGRFDGAHLVGNFEKLDPANTYWKKAYNLYASIDTEGPRYLEFEKWWSGFFLLNTEEIESITDELFVGNKLSSGGIIGKDGRRLDLRNIRSPILVFASFGDNITPPQQALGWILDLYDSVEDIRSHEQTIVYNLHHDIGHLGIFVSGRVARKETAEFVENIELVDLLPPGLYEMVIEPKDPNAPGADLVAGAYVTRFEERTLDDIRALGGNTPEDDRRFATVSRISDVNKGLYDSFARPWIRAMVTEPMAEWLRLSNPARAQYYLFSHLNPFLAPVETLAHWAREHRRPVARDNPFLEAQTRVSDAIAQALDNYRDRRDAAVEQLFLTTYNAPLLQALVGLAAPEAEVRPPRVRDEAFEALVEKRMAEIAARVADGGLREALFRILVFVGRERGSVDERAFQTLRQIREEYPAAKQQSLDEVRAVFREQVFLILIDEEAAMAALPVLLPEEKDRKTVLELAERILSAAGPLTADQRARMREVSSILERDREEAGEETALRVVSRGAGSSVAEAAAEISRAAKRRRSSRTERAK